MSVSRILLETGKGLRGLMKKNGLTRAQRWIIAQSLCRVGSTKSVGYLPINTIDNILGLDISTMKNYFEDRGLFVVVLGANMTCINSGAFVVIDKNMLLECAKKHDLIEIMSDSSIERLIRILFKTWHGQDHKFMGFIREAYGDTA